MAKTVVTQFNLYVDGVLHAGFSAHRVYDLGYSTDPKTTAESVYGDINLSAVRNMDIVSTDFMSVLTARLESSTTTTIDIPEAPPETQVVEVSELTEAFGEF